LCESKVDLQQQAKSSPSLSIIFGVEITSNGVEAQ
jgi:hypothetical protein